MTVHVIHVTCDLISPINNLIIDTDDNFNYSKKFSCTVNLNREESISVYTEAASFNR